MLSAYFTRLGHVLMRGVDVLMAFPALLLALVLMTLLERSVTNTIIVIGIVYATTTARILFRHDIETEGRSLSSTPPSALGAGHGSDPLPAYPAKPDVSPLLVQASFIFRLRPACRPQRLISLALAFHPKCQAGATC